MNPHNTPVRGNGSRRLLEGAFPKVIMNHLVRHLPFILSSIVSYPNPVLTRDSFTLLVIKTIKSQSSIDFMLAKFRTGTV